MSLSGQVAGETVPSLIPVAILSGLCACGRWVLTQRWLAPRGSRHRPSPLVLLCRMSPATSATGFFGAAIFESDMFGRLARLPEPLAVWARIAFVGSAVVLMVSAELRVCQLMSALLLGMMTPLHNVTIIIYGVLTSEHADISLCNWAGIVLCSGATLLYSWARHDEADPSTGGGEAKEPLEMAQASGFVKLSQNS